MANDPTNDYIRLISTNDLEKQELAFLYEEGLELLAAYRRVEDRQVRLALLELVKSLDSKLPLDV